MGNTNEIKNIKTGRHPVYQAADKLKKVFLKLGFRLVDNGEGLEVEKTGVTFATWKEPSEIFGWQNAPIFMRYGCTILRTRLLPAHLRTLEQSPPFRLLSFGHVYQNNKDYPKRHQIEGIIVEKGQTLDTLKKLWQDVANELFAENAGVSFESLCEDAYKISVKNLVDGKTYVLGYTGPASAQTMKIIGAGEEFSSWVFVIDVDQFTLQYFSLADVSLLYENDINLLTQSKCEDPAEGDCPAYLAIDWLRKMGYYETCSDVLYPSDAYVKMNMIMEEWDTNNSGYPLEVSLGDFVATRTVITPALEKIMGLNYKRGVTDFRAFEVGHIFLPKKDQVMPKEQLAISMGSYGPDVSFESFRKDVLTFLKAFGITSPKFMTTNMATAYKWNECMILFDENEYVGANYGRIHEKACKNHAIGVPAYMAQFELNPLLAMAKKYK